MRNLIVLRPSPDWPRFDVESSRQFLASVGFAENLVVDFVEIWDRTFTVDYRSLREALKSLSLASYRAVVDAECIPLEAFDASACEANDRIEFADDDDWLAPDLFSALPSEPADGFRWGSLRVGLDFDPTAPGAAFCAPRPLNGVVYTNNYALGGRSLIRLGLQAVSEHPRAHGAFLAPGFAVRDSARYLSCAVKHPCSTVAVRAQMANDFRAQPERSFERFQRALATAVPPAEGAWVAGSLRALREIFDAVRNLRT